MELFSIVLISGISVGSIYGLIALTLTSIYNASRVLNFAQGEFVMLGALGAYLLNYVLHIPLPVTIIITILFVSLVALALQRYMVSPLVNRGASASVLILATLSAGLIISGTVGVATNFEWLRIEPLLGTKPLVIFGFAIIPQNLIIICTTFVLVILYWLFLNKTMIGVALRTVGANKDMASLLGIRNNRMIGIAFIVSASMAAIAGILIAPVAASNSNMGLGLVIKGFIASIFGGLGNPFAAVLGGLILGIIQAFLTGYLSSAHAEIITFIILLAVLIPRPQGLFGKPF